MENDDRRMIGKPVTPAERPLEERLGEPVTNLDASRVRARILKKRNSQYATFTFTDLREEDPSDLLLDLAVAINALDLDNWHAESDSPNEEATGFISNNQGQGALLAYFHAVLKGNVVTVTTTEPKIGPYTQEQVLVAYVKNLQKA